MGAGSAGEARFVTASKKYANQIDRRISGLRSAPLTIATWPLKSPKRFTGEVSTAPPLFVRQNGEYSSAPSGKEALHLFQRY
jgi:hypothetical protein